MKKRIPILFALIVAVSLMSVWAVFRGDAQGTRPQLGGRPEVARPEVAPQALPGTYISQGGRHKMIVKNEDAAVYNEMARRGAIRKEFNYGSFKLIEVEEQPAGGRGILQAQPLNVRDDQNLIALNGYVLDTSRAEPLAESLPVEMRQTRMATARSAGLPPAAGTYIVQFAGPVQDAWLRELRNSGAEIISYVPNNAYIVRTTRRPAAAISRMQTQRPYVQWVGDYQPAYKLSPSLREARTQTALQTVRVTLQVLDGAAGTQVIDDLRRTSTRYEGSRRVLKYRNVTTTIPASRLTALAQADSVFAIEPAPERVRLDEAQGQIVAGNLAGANPTGPGYLTWLAGKGFNSGQFGSFAVNVVDDAFSLTGHPDLSSTRIAFENNPTRQTGAQGGHGFLNSHIVGGFNDGTGSANEDSNGFNYGLGIAPWARVGVTAIFGNTGASATAWEGAAYGRGSRISSNSWGEIDQARRPIAIYNTTSQEFDAIARDAQPGVAGNQQLAIVFAAGNSGAGANSVGAPGTAKNVITVGASENVRQTGTDGCGIDNGGANNAGDIIGFSSRGPVNASGGDGRFKPDLMAPGTHVEAGVPQSNYDGTSVCDKFFPAGQTLYGWSSGTSHSTPAVAGGVALIYQDFLNRGLGAPSPAMIKALLMNSATYMAGSGANDRLPSNNQGMGRMDLGRAFDGTARMLTDQTQVFGASGQTHQVTGSVAATDKPFRVTLAWTDAPGSVTGGPWVNNLDLEVTVGGTTFRGNVFTGANSTPGGAADGRNNVESVFLPAGTSGNFTVTVRAINIAGDGVPGNGDTTDQDFALVIYNGGTAAPAPPTIDINPASLSFTAMAGGANPANQILNLTNTGGGTLAWTAGDNAPWLTVAAASGTAPATLTASVNIAGLAAGTFNGTITITGTGATNSPVTVLVSLTINPPAPVISVTPSSLSFAGTAGGPAPASKTIALTNTGGGALSWTAADDASWLSVSPASGNAPATLTVSVNPAGLAAGAFNGTITITSTGATNTPVTVPVALQLSAPSSTDLIVNGGFEGSINPWVPGGGAFRSTGAFPHGGSGYLFMGSSNRAAHTTYQQITIPAGSAPSLNFWLNITSGETTTTRQYDLLFVEVRSTTGALLATLATFSNLDKTAAAGDYTSRGPLSLAAFAGQTVRLQFRVTTDRSLSTTFRIDDVSVR
ncbi:MAG: S8 family serine peptidase [Blastocatellia bacterium]